MYVKYDGASNCKFLHIKYEWIIFITFAKLRQLQVTVSWSWYKIIKDPREAFKKEYYLDREIVPFSSDTPTIGPVSEHLDREYW